MDKRDIAMLVHFNFWANDRILTTCERISADEFTRLHMPDPGWGSLRGILVNTLDTEYGWRSVLQACTFSPMASSIVVKPRLS